MPKVTGPLFSIEAHGPIKGFGSFRMGRHGPELIQPRTTRQTFTPAQLAHQALFAEAHAEWMALEPQERPLWATFWAQWYEDYLNPPAPATRVPDAFYGHIQILKKPTSTRKLVYLVPCWRLRNE